MNAVNQSCPVYFDCGCLAARIRGDEFNGIELMLLLARGTQY